MIRNILKSALAIVLLVPSATLYAEKSPLSEEQQAKIAAYEFQTKEDGVIYLNVERAVRTILGDEFVDSNSRGHDRITAAIVALAERLPEGAALHLGSFRHRGGYDLRGIKDNLVITGRGTVRLGGAQRGIQVLHGPNLVVDSGLDGDTTPLRDLVMLFGSCGYIGGDIEDSSFISAVDVWGVNGFRAKARVDNTLFLWFSSNWHHGDYNAHLGNPDPDWWKKNAQVIFDLNGGGKNTRVYLMVETNYGNPGTGVWLRNVNGMAMLHGATERPSAQGPGVYYLENCENVLLGLRRNFCGTRGGGTPGMPAHGMTIEGGRNNVLYIYSDFSNSYDTSLVNRENDLQLWSVALDFEAEGVDEPDIMRFAFTPEINMPAGDNIKEAEKIAETQAAGWVRGRNRRGGLPVTDENIAAVQELVKRGRDIWWPMNATREQTFMVAGVDLTTAPEALPGNAKLPPPPSFPATDAPKEFRPLYFTWEADFGSALLEAGADPTGKELSDDAFAQVMYGMDAAEVQELVAKAKAGDREAYNKLNPIDEERSTERQRRRISRPRLEIPAGTFRLSKTLHMGELNSNAMGAGADRTILKFEGDIACIRQYHHGGLTGFTVEGGRTGLAITGADHNAPGGEGYNKSYIAGSVYYDLTFRNQTFAGIHIGNEDPEVLGGAEFDQNRFVNMRFINTGDYGIFMNNDMTDKWLVLNNEFIGQNKAGISIKFNNLIHGGVYGSRFENINGPGIDFRGGNPHLAFVPYVVMVDQCEFIECGSETAPAVDYGYGELSSFTRCRIITRDKQILAGFKGAAQHYEDVEVDVNLVEGGHAMEFRAVRNAATARANGHVIREVRANGPIAFINDINEINPLYAKTIARRNAGIENPDNRTPVDEDGIPKINWDTNPAVHELPPPNGWVHPFIVYRSQFGEDEYTYSLLNVDTDNNRIMDTIDLSHLE